MVHIRSQDGMSSATIPTGTVLYAHFVRPELILEAATSVENSWENGRLPGHQAEMVQPRSNSSTPSWVSSAIWCGTPHVKKKATTKKVTEVHSNIVNLINLRKVQ